jgi:hypothetical protein
MKSKPPLLLLSILCLSIPLVLQTIPPRAAIDAKVGGITAQTETNGIAGAVVANPDIALVLG